MRFCSSCGAQLWKKHGICPNCGCELAGDKTKGDINVDDVIDIKLCLLSLVFPPFAFVYSHSHEKTAPKKARACRVAAGITISILFLIFFAKY